MKRFLILILFIALIYLAYDILGSYALNSTSLFMRAGMDDDLNKAMTISMITNIEEHTKLIFPIELRDIVSKSTTDTSIYDEVINWSKYNNLLPNDDALRIGSAKDNYRTLEDINAILQPWKLDEVINNVPKDIQSRHSNNKTFADLLKDHLKWKWSIGDGNCFFVSLKQCLEATKIMGKLNSYRLRAEVVKFMCDHTSVSEAYLNRMRNYREYADDNAIKAACILYNINIITIRNPSRNDGYPTVSKFGPTVSGTTIWMQYSGDGAAGHFDSLIYTDKYDKKIVDSIKNQNQVKVINPNWYQSFEMKEPERKNKEKFNTAEITDDYSPSYNNNGSKNRNRYYLLLQVISTDDLENFLDQFTNYILDRIDEGKEAKIFETYRDIKDMTYIGTDFDKDKIQLRDLYNLPMNLSRTVDKEEIKTHRGIEVLDFTDFHHYLIEKDIEHAMEAKKTLMNKYMQHRTTDYFLPIVKPKNVNLTFRYEIWKIISKFPEMHERLGVKDKSKAFLKAYNDGTLTCEPKHSTAMFVDMNELTVHKEKVGITEEGIRKRFKNFNK